MVYRGHVANGTIRLDADVLLPEGTEVQVAVLSESESVTMDSETTLYERLKPLVGAAKGLPPDLARNHDHYLHGRAKQSNLVFADTYYYLALLSEDDEGHKRADAFSRNYTGRVLTTTWVLTEVADALAAPHQRSLFTELLEFLRRDPKTSISPPSDELFDKGCGLYSRRPDKEWSLTDCISFTAMQEHEISKALTGDHHFEQAGFELLL